MNNIIVIKLRMKQNCIDIYSIFEGCVAEILKNNNKYVYIFSLVILRKCLKVHLLNLSNQELRSGNQECYPLVPDLQTFFQEDNM